MLFMGLCLPACDNLGKSDNSESNQAYDEFKDDDEDKQSLKANSRIFSGCYTVDKSEPAQIKVSQQDNGLVMQMKEPVSAKRVWDSPEPLEILDVNQSSNYFSIESKEVTHLIARPDKLLVIAHVDSAFANMDPLLDSDYLGYILQGANTIFKVECDDIHSDEVVEGKMSNITIKTLPNTNSL